MPLNQKNELAQVVEESTLPIEHKFKRESPTLTPPSGFQPKQHTTVKKRHRGEDR